MDRRLQESVTRGDVWMLKKLLDEDPDLIKQTVPGIQNTVAHLAARFGHLEFVREVVNVCPELVSRENADLETSLHIACREGHLDIVRVLMETDPDMADRLNCRDESVLFAACDRGHAHVAGYLMEVRDHLMMFELDLPTTSLHLAASSGNTEIIKLLLKSRPDFAWKKNPEGCTALHVACSKGHLDEVRELLMLDADLCRERDNEGRNPLHYAAGRGRINIIAEILSQSLDLAETVTYYGETILHLAVKNNQYETVKYITDFLNTSRLLNAQDHDGNTALHLATAGKLTTMVRYLLSTGVEVNTLNQRGYTPLDVVETHANNSGTLVIIPELERVGGKRCSELSQNRYAEIQEMVIRSVPPGSPREMIPIQSMSRRNQCSPRYRKKRAKKVELQNEGLRNARKTVIIVAVLIATVTFAAGINPPGGFDQQTGKALRGNYMAFKVFLICNILALFLSIGVVNVLVSIIPFTREIMMKLLSGTHKVMWLSTLFMAAAYVAAIWTILPDNKGGRRHSMELAILGGGFSIFVFLGLGLLLARHWYNKYNWRRKKNADGSPLSTSSRVDELKVKTNYNITGNSDIDSSDHGYHLY